MMSPPFPSRSPTTSTLFGRLDPYSLPNKLTQYHPELFTDRNYFRSSFSQRACKHWWSLEAKRKNPTAGSSWVSEWKLLVTFIATVRCLKLDAKLNGSLFPRIESVKDYFPTLLLHLPRQSFSCWNLSEVIVRSQNLLHDALRWERSQSYQLYFLVTWCRMCILLVQWLSSNS